MHVTPDLSQVETTIKRNHHPVVIGTYVWGEEKVINVENTDPEKIMSEFQRLRNTYDCILLLFAYHFLTQPLLMKTTVQLWAEDASPRYPCEVSNAIHPGGLESKCALPVSRG